MAEVDLGVVRLPDRPAPRALVVAMHENRPAMAAGDAGQRPLLRRHVVEIDAERHRAVVGVRPSRNVLVPIDDLARARVFVVELARVKLDVGPDKIRGDVGERRFAADAPEIGVAIDERTQPADMRVVRPMLRADIEFLVRPRDAAALLDEFERAGAQHFLPLVGDQSRRREETALEILLALRLAQHARLMGEDGFGGHSLLSLASVWVELRSRSARIEPLLSARGGTEVCGEPAFADMRVKRKRMKIRWVGASFSNR